MAYYPFNGNANDSSGNGNNGSYIGTPQFANGTIGQAISLHRTFVGDGGTEGTGDAVEIPNSPSLHFDASQESYSVSAWGKPARLNTDGANDEFRIIEDRSNNGAVSYTLGFSGPFSSPGNIEKMFLWVRSGLNGATGFNNTTNIAPITMDVPRWTHLVMVVSGGTLKGYSNGTLLGQVDVSSCNDTRTADNIQIGRGRKTVGYCGYFDGLIDEVRVYNRALSTTEITTLYGQASDLVAPVISAVAASNITTSRAAITWTTDENSTSVVEYGPITTYGSVASVAGSVTNHSVPLSALASGTTYHYRVRSADSVGNESLFTDLSFQTAFAIRAGDWLFYDDHQITGDTSGHIWKVRLDGTNATQLTNWVERDAQPSIRPDGQWVAFCRMNAARTGAAVMRMNADGSNVQTLYTSPSGYAVEYPEWSFDGTKIVFQAWPIDGTYAKIGPFEVWLVHSDGSGAAAVVKDSFDNSAPTFHPNNGRIYFNSNRSGQGTEFFSVLENGTDIQRLTAGTMVGNDWGLWNPQGG